jgi:hypothetical protein
MVMPAGTAAMLPNHEEVEGQAGCGVTTFSCKICGQDDSNHDETRRIWRWC